MPGERYELQRPGRVREMVAARCAELGLTRADIKVFKRDDWKDSLGTWTYDQLMRQTDDPPRLLRDKLRKLSVVLGWESDGIERIDTGLEPLPLVEQLGSNHNGIEPSAVGPEPSAENLAEVAQGQAELAESLATLAQILTEGSPDERVAELERRAAAARDRARRLGQQVRPTREGPHRHRGRP